MIPILWTVILVVWTLGCVAAAILLAHLIHGVHRGNKQIDDITKGADMAEKLGKVNYEGAIPHLCLLYGQTHVPKWDEFSDEMKEGWRRGAVAVASLCSDERNRIRRLA